MVVRRPACVFERFPRAFEENAMLRIENLRFARRDAEKAGVEQFGALQHRATRHKQRIGSERLGNACFLQVNVAEGLEDLLPGSNIAPEFVQVLRTREATREADDGNGMSRVRFAVLILSHGLSSQFGPAHVTKGSLSNRAEKSSCPPAQQPWCAETVRPMENRFQIRASVRYVAEPAAVSGLQCRKSSRRDQCARTAIRRAKWRPRGAVRRS